MRLCDYHSGFLGLWSQVKLGGNDMLSSQGGIKENQQSLSILSWVPQAGMEPRDQWSL